MQMTRRQAIATGVVLSFARPPFLSARADGAVSAQTEPEGQFTPPPSPPTDKELELLALAVETARHTGVSDLVQDERFLSLHPQPVFRELVKAVARDPVLTIPRSDEPGSRIIASGRIEIPSGAPVAGAIAYVYHTSAKGWYSDKAAHVRAWAGDTRHARLFGYLKTGDDGSFEIRTIRPGGYPRTDLPQHIHFEVDADGYQPRVTELLFDDDPRLTTAQRDRAKHEGFIIAAASGASEDKPTFRYKVVMTKA
jgi:protocatechuate 3,4-dioxygenase beta subunit